MVSLFDRFFSDDVSVPQTSIALTFDAHPRIHVKVFEDWPMYLAVYHVDGKPALKENMVQTLDDFFHQTCNDRNLQAFLLEYGNALQTQC